MAEPTLTGGLKRLLGLCPQLTLDPHAIQLIIDGKQNQVILEHKQSQKPTKTTVRVVAPKTVTVDDDRSFNEYFVTKQAD